jgi:hypothetical protein
MTRSGYFAWNQPELFFFVDACTRRAFDVRTAVALDRDFFHAGPVVAKTF